MSLHRKPRLLVAGEHSCLWQVGHRHPRVGVCEEFLSIRRVGAPSRRTLTFRAESGFLVPDGGMSAAGVIGDDRGHWLNLNEPGVVRAFIDSLAAGWPPDDRRSLTLDGWPYLRAAHRLRHPADPT